MAYKYKKDRDKKLLVKVLLRKKLADYLNIDHKDVVVDRDDHCRPFLKNKGEKVRDFNLSYSGEWIILAISDKNRVGVDVEKYKNIDFEEVIKDHFAPEEIDYINKNRKVSLYRFYQLWTLKEALLKAVGKGLATEGPLSRVCFEISGDNIKLRSGNNGDWQFKLLDLEGYYQLSVCFNSKEDDNFKINYSNEFIL